MHSFYIIVKKNREFWSKFWVDKPACLQKIAKTWIQQFTRKIDNRNRQSLILLHFPLLTIMCNIFPCIKINSRTVFSFSYILKIPQKILVAPVSSELVPQIQTFWANMGLFSLLYEVYQTYCVFVIYYDIVICQYEITYFLLSSSI